MPQALPISRIVKVDVILTPAGARSQSLRDLLILGNSTVIDSTERMRTYFDVNSIAADFGIDSPEYQAAALWFQQNPQPTQILIGRWVNFDAPGGLRCASLTPTQRQLSNFTAVTAGALQYRVDGGALTALTGLDFSAETNLNGVASVIQAAFTAALVDVFVVWNENLSRFEFTSATEGEGSSFNFLEAPEVGTDVAALVFGKSNSSGAYTFDGQDAETAAEAVNLFDDRFGQSWYALVMPTAEPDEQLTVAGVIEASINKHILGVTTQEQGVLVASFTGDVASLLKDLNYTRTMVQYSSANAYAVVSALARILTTDYNGNNTVITLKFKQEPGIIAETLPASQVTVLQSKSANVFINYSNETAILEQGVMTNGEFVDVITSTDWLAVTVQTALYNLLYTSTTKIPQTDQGQQLLLTTCEGVLSQAVTNGMLAPGVWNSGGFGQIKQGDFLPKGFYAYSPSFNLQQPSDRAARKAMPIQIAAKLAGAVHSIDVAINVNQ